MKVLLILTLLSAFARSSFALTCYGCDISDSSTTCNFTYNCSKSTEFCETLVSKVEGNYSVILSCSTMEKCGAHKGFNDGDNLEDCDHSKPNTECFSCCDDDKCNSLHKALKKLPKDVFHKNDTKSSKKEFDEQESFLEELERMIADDEKRLENDELLYDESETERNETTRKTEKVVKKGDAKLSNESAEVPSSNLKGNSSFAAVNLTESSKELAKSVDSVKVSRESSALNASSEAKKANGTLSLSSEPAKITTNTQPAVKNETSSSNATTVTKASGSKPNSVDKSQEPSRGNKPEERLPELDDTDELTPEHHALVGDSASSVQLNLPLFFVAFIVITFVSSLIN